MAHGKGIRALLAVDPGAGEENFLRIDKKGLAIFSLVCYNKFHDAGIIHR